MKKMKVVLFAFLVLPFAVISQNMLIPAGNNLTINQGASIVFNNNYDLRVQSTATGSGSIIDLNPANAAVFTGSGQSVVEMYISANDWHYISSPVATCEAGLFMDMYLKQFAEPDSNWSYITQTNYTLNPMQGYALWSPLAITGNTTLAFTGEFNTGEYAQNLTKTGTSTHNSKGFNFIGNPYPSAVNWQLGAEAWGRTNIDPIIYLWNPLAGQYGTYNRNTKLGSNDVDSIIPAKQGFFIHVTDAGSGSITINNQARLHHHKQFFKAKQNPTALNTLRLQVAGNGYSDESVICFNDQATNGFDPAFDAYKLHGKAEAPQLFTKTLNIPVAVNTLQCIADNPVVPLYLTTQEGYNLTIEATGIDSFDDDVPVWLEDIKTQHFQDLRTNPVYLLAGNPADNAHRLNIYFTLPNNVPENNWYDGIQVYSVHHTVHVLMPEALSGNLDILNTMGQLVTKVNAVSGTQTIELIAEPAIYLVRIKTNQGVYSKKIYIN